MSFRITQRSLVIPGTPAGCVPHDSAAPADGATRDADTHIPDGDPDASNGAGNDDAGEPGGDGAGDGGTSPARGPTRYPTAPPSRSSRSGRRVGIRLGATRRKVLRRTSGRAVLPRPRELLPAMDSRPGTKIW